MAMEMTFTETLLVFPLVVVPGLLFCIVYEGWKRTTGKRSFGAEIAFAVVMFIAMAFLIAGCAAGTEPANEEIPENQSAQWTQIGDKMYRFIDSEMNVICWVYVAFRRAGLSCLPMSEVDNGN